MLITAFAVQRCCSSCVVEASFLYRTTEFVTIQEDLQRNQACALRSVVLAFALAIAIGVSLSLLGVVVVAP